MIERPEPCSAAALSSLPGSGRGAGAGPERHSARRATASGCEYREFRPGAHRRDPEGHSGTTTARCSTSTDDLGIEDERTFEVRGAHPGQAGHKLRGSYTPLDYTGDVEDAPQAFTYGSTASSASSRVVSSSRARYCRRGLRVGLREGPARVPGRRRRGAGHRPGHRRWSRRTSRSPRGGHAADVLPVLGARHARVRGPLSLEGEISRLSWAAAAACSSSSGRRASTSPTAWPSRAATAFAQRRRTSATRRAQASAAGTSAWSSASEAALRRAAGHAAGGGRRRGRRVRGCTRSRSTSTTCASSAGSRRNTLLAYGHDLARLRAFAGGAAAGPCSACGRPTWPTSSAACARGGLGRALGGAGRPRRARPLPLRGARGPAGRRPHGEPARRRARSRRCRAT